MADEIPDELLDQLAEEPPRPIRITLKPSQRASVLASVSVELETDVGVITINDGRILRNKAGALWFASPTFSVSSGKQYEYFPTVELPSALLRIVSVAALAEFEQWEKRQHQLAGAR
jgi:hypothetical protein